MLEMFLHRFLPLYTCTVSVMYIGLRQLKTFFIFLSSQIPCVGTTFYKMLTQGPYAWSIPTAWFWDELPLQHCADLLNWQWKWLLCGGFFETLFLMWEHQCPVSKTAQWPRMVLQGKLLLWVKYRFPIDHHSVCRMYKGQFDSKLGNLRVIFNHIFWSFTIYMT